MQANHVDICRSTGRGDDKHRKVRAAMEWLVYKIENNVAEAPPLQKYSYSTQ